MLHIRNDKILWSKIVQPLILAGKELDSLRLTSINLFEDNDIGCHLAIL
jgi:hypothetical protein